MHLSSIFSDKEWTVAFLLLQGMAEQEIADVISRTVRTVKFHKGNVQEKTSCSTTQGFIMPVRKNGNFVSRLYFQFIAM